MIDQPEVFGMHDNANIAFQVRCVPVNLPRFRNHAEMAGIFNVVVRFFILSFPRVRLFTIYE